MHGQPHIRFTFQFSLTPLEVAKFRVVWWTFYFFRVR